MENYTKIPASAWEGVGDPDESTPPSPCQVCGNTNTKIISMAEMMNIDGRVINENTFMISGLCWGYISCNKCESKTAESNNQWMKMVLYWQLKMNTAIGFLKHCITQRQRPSPSRGK